MKRQRSLSLWSVVKSVDKLPSSIASDEANSAATATSASMMPMLMVMQQQQQSQQQMQLQQAIMQHEVEMQIKGVKAQMKEQN